MSTLLLLFGQSSKWDAPSLPVMLAVLPRNLLISFDCVVLEPSLLILLLSSASWWPPKQWVFQQNACSCLPEVFGSIREYPQPSAIRSQTRLLKVLFSILYSTVTETLEDVIREGVSEKARGVELRPLRSDPSRPRIAFMGFSSGTSQPTFIFDLKCNY